MVDGPLARYHRDFLPELFRDVGNNGMCQAQHGFQHADQRATRTQLLCWCAVLDLHLGQFHIPIAVLIPNETIDGVGDVVRSEERRVGKEWVSTCRSRWSPYH